MQETAAGIPKPQASLKTMSTKVLTRALKTMSTQVSPTAVELLKMGNGCPRVLMFKLLTRVLNDFGSMMKEEVWTANGEIAALLQKHLVEFLQQIFHHTTNKHE